MSLTILTAVAVFVHLGTSIAALLLKDRTDQQKISELNSKVDQVLGIVTAVAPVLPTTLPKTLGQGLADVAAVAGALAPTQAPA
jgi:hypothetical protein